MVFFQLVVLANFRMSLLQLGPTIFGGTPGIITYMQSNGLLATAKTCARYINTHEKLHACTKCHDRVSISSGVEEYQ